MPTKSIFVTDETEAIVKQLERGNESHIYREAIRAFDRLNSLFGNKWEFELHEAAQALKLVREMFGQEWQEEWQKIKEVVEKMR